MAEVLAKELVNNLLTMALTALDGKPGFEANDTIEVINVSSDDSHGYSSTIVDEESKNHVSSDACETTFVGCVVNEDNDKMELNTAGAANDNNLMDFDNSYIGNSCIVANDYKFTNKMHATPVKATKAARHSILEMFDPLYKNLDETQELDKTLPPDVDEANIQNSADLEEKNLHESQSTDSEQTDLQESLEELGFLESKENDSPHFNENILVPSENDKIHELTNHMLEEIETLKEELLQIEKAKKAKCEEESQWFDECKKLETQNALEIERLLNTNKSSETVILQQQADALHAQELSLRETLKFDKKTYEDNLNTIKECDEIISNAVQQTLTLHAKTIVVEDRLSGMELAFAKLIQKYEHAKEIIKNYESNAVILKNTLEDGKQKFKAFETRYSLLHSHAKTQIEFANKDMVQMVSKHDIEVKKFRADIKRNQIKLASLKSLLDHKNAECAALGSFYDDVMRK